MVRHRFQRGCLIKRGKRNPAWVARWRETVIQPNGSICRVQRSAVIALVRDVATRREAQALLESYLRELNLNKRRVQATLSFGEFAQKWEEAVLPTYRVSTRNFYHEVLHRHLLPYFADWRLGDLRTADIQVFLNQKVKQYAPAVLYHIRATLSRVFASAREWSYADANPAAGVKLPHKQTLNGSVTFQPEEVRRILGRLAEPYRTMGVVAALTGVRASELFALTWEDVDFERRLLHIRRSFYHGEFGPPKSKASERAIPMGASLAAVLEGHRLHTKSNALGLVFANAKGMPCEPSSIVRRVLRPAMRALGLPEAGWRAFRRTVATAFSELREPVRTAQQVLGHSSPQTTLAIYTQTVEESQRRAMGKLEELLFPTVPKIEVADAGGHKLVN